MELNAPVYIRLGREATTSLYAEDVKYEIGKALIPREGNDGAFVCTGIMVHFAMEAAKRMQASCFILQARQCQLLFLLPWEH